LEAQFNKTFKKGRFKKGKNYVTFKVAQTYITSFLKEELKDLKNGASIEIISLEEKLEYSIEVPGISYPIKLKGLADRIDLRNDEIRIVDYKTGRVDPSKLVTGDFSELASNTKFKYVLQVLFYTVLYVENNPGIDISNIKSGIISFKNFKEGFMTCNFGKTRTKDFEMTQERYQQYKDALAGLLFEIFSSETSFKENPDKQYAWV
jgi:hypothetical protein